MRRVRINEASLRLLLLPGKCPFVGSPLGVALYVTLEHWRGEGVEVGGALEPAGDGAGVQVMDGGDMLARLVR